MCEPDYRTCDWETIKKSIDSVNENNSEFEKWNFQSLYSLYILSYWYEEFEQYPEYAKYQTKCFHLMDDFIRYARSGILKSLFPDKTWVIRAFYEKE